VRPAVGECLACTKLGTCRETNLELVLSGHTCILFKPAPEPVYRARAFMMSKHGERAAVRGMLDSTTQPEGENDV
jgi:hypothetical protein